METWKICGRAVSPGTKVATMIEPGFPGYEIPATLICGSRPGKTTVITAGIHSGEYPGVAAVIRAARAIDPKQVTGNILLFHCVNTSGFKAKTHGVVAEDGVNLNADYPGRRDGTPGERIADYFVREIFPQADFLLDMHSGGAMEALTACLFFPAAAGARVRETALAAAMALDIPYLIASRARRGEYSYAAGLGIPGLLLERGCGGRCEEAWIKAYERDIFLLLDHLKHYQAAAKETVCEKQLFEQTTYLTASEDALWYPLIKEGACIKKGQLIGRTEDFFGTIIRAYHAECDGLVFYYTRGLAVSKGDPLAAYGRCER